MKSGGDDGGIQHPTGIMFDCGRGGRESDLQTPGPVILTSVTYCQQLPRDELASSVHNKTEGSAVGDWTAGEEGTRRTREDFLALFILPCGFSQAGLNVASV